MTEEEQYNLLRRISILFEMNPAGINCDLCQKEFPYYNGIKVYLSVLTKNPIKVYNICIFGHDEEMKKFEILYADESIDWMGL